jgi:hypothetical protein
MRTISVPTKTFLNLFSCACAPLAIFSGSIMNRKNHGLVVPPSARSPEKGRKSIATAEEVAKVEEVLAQVAAGSSVNAATKKLGIGRDWFARALANLPAGDGSEKLRQARELQAESLVDAAESEIDGLRADIEKNPELASAIVAAARVRSDLKRWHAARISPILYGEKASGGVSVAVQVNQSPQAEVAAARKAASERVRAMLRGELVPDEDGCADV